MAHGMGTVTALSVGSPQGFPLTCGWSKKAIVNRGVTRWGVVDGWRCKALCSQPPGALPYGDYRWGARLRCLGEMTDRVGKKRLFCGQV